MDRLLLQPRVMLAPRTLADSLAALARLEEAAAERLRGLVLLLEDLGARPALLAQVREAQTIEAARAASLRRHAEQHGAVREVTAAPRTYARPLDVALDRALTRDLDAHEAAWTAELDAWLASFLTPSEQAEVRARRRRERVAGSDIVELCGLPTRDVVLEHLRRKSPA